MMEGQQRRRVPPQAGTPPPQRVPPRYRYGPQSHTGRVPWNFGNTPPQRQRQQRFNPTADARYGMSPPGRLRSQRLPDGRQVYADGTELMGSISRRMREQRIIDSLSAVGPDPDQDGQPNDEQPLVTPVAPRQRPEPYNYQ